MECGTWSRWALVWLAGLVRCRMKMLAVLGPELELKPKPGDGRAEVFGPVCIAESGLASTVFDCFGAAAPYPGTTWPPHCVLDGGSVDFVRVVWRVTEGARLSEAVDVAAGSRVVDWLRAVCEARLVSVFS